MQSNFFQNFLMLSQYQTLGALFCLFAFFYLLKKMQNKQIDFSIRMLVGLFGGILFGLILQFFAGYPDDEISSQIVWLTEVRNWFGFFANAFIACIKMLVIPIVGISIIKVLLELDKGVKIAELFGRSLFWILFSVGIAATVGVLLAYFFNLSIHFQNISTKNEIREVKSIMQILLGLIPSNIIESMGKNNVIALVFFCFILGFGARSVGKEEGFNDIYQTFENFVLALHKIIMNITLFIIKFMPYAIVCMMAEVLLSNGMDAIKSATNFIILTYIAMIVMFFVHILMIAFYGLNPLKFIKKALPVWIFAFSSRSSVGTLPLTISTLQKMGVSGGVANFVASIGTTIGLNGCAGYFPAMAAIFIASSIGVPIDFSFVAIVILMAILGSLGIAGIPGSATMAASIMLTGIGFSDYFVLLSIILAIDPIIDMARTASNVSGAMTAAICTDKGLKTLDLKVFNT